MKKSTYLLTLLLTALLCLPWGSNAWAETFTYGASASGSNEYIPIYGYYCDNAQHNQFIIPASELGNIQNGTITQLTFYAAVGYYSPTWNSGSAPTVTIKLAEVSESNVSSGLISGTFTQYYSGTFALNSTTGEWNIPISNFTYEGGNLLVDVTTADAGYSHVYFVGNSVTGAGRCTYGYSANSIQNFIPKTTFTYTPGAAPSCYKPTSVAASDITGETATISWAKDVRQTDKTPTWQYLYWAGSTEPTEDDWLTATETSETSVDLENLSAITTYSFFVRADCGDDDYSNYASTSFKTACGKVSLSSTGWDYDFDSDAVNSIPDCWKRVTSSSYYPCVDNTYKHSGSNSIIYVGYSYDGAQYVVLPEFESEIRNLKLSLWYMTNSSTYAKEMSIGYITNAETATYTTAAYTAVSTLTNNTSWSQVTNVLFSDAPDGARIAIYMKGTKTSSSYKGRLYIDDIHIESALDCSAPQGVSCTATTTSTADFGWTANAGVESYNYCVVAQGEEPDWSGDLSTATNSIHVEELTPGDYTFYVKCACGTAVSDAVDFSVVSCPAVSAVTLTNKLYNSVTVNWTSGADACDVRYSTDGGTNWVAAGENISTTSKDVTVAVGNTYTFAVKPSCGDEESWVTCGETYTPEYPVPGTPAVASIAETTASASWTAATGATGYEYVIMPGTTAADWTSPTAVGAVSASLTGLAAGTNYTIYVRAKFGEGRGEEVSKNFTTTTVAPEFSFVEPTIGKTTASIRLATYTGTASQFQYVCMPGTTAANWASASLVASTTTKIDLDGLTAGTSYTLYVRAYYGETIQSSAISKAFTTECDIYNLPFSENFSGSSKPNCWTIANWGTSTNSWTLASDYSKTGNALKYNAKTNSSCNVVSPSIYIDDKAELSFYVRNYYYYYSAYYVAGKVIISDGVNTKEVDYGNNSSITQKTVDLSEFAGKTVTITFQGNGAGTSMSSAYLWIDDVDIHYLPIAIPTGLTATPTADGAVVSWSHAEDGPFDLQYRVHKDEEPLEEWTTVSVDAKEKTLTGLATGTTYDIRVRANISANRKSEYTEPITFTPVACPAVTAVTFGDKTYNSVVVNWTAEGTADKWDLRYKKGSDEWTVVSEIAAMAKTLEGLTTNETYTVEVKATCGNEEAWVAAGETYTPVYTAPATATASASSDIAASASWEAVADATGYEYLVLASGEPDWSSATSTSETSVASLGTLVGGTNYTFYVRAVYPSGNSAATTANFTTSTIAPLNLENTEATTTTATFTWEANGAATKYQWKTSKTGSDWSEPTTDLTATAEGLEPGSGYTFYVRSYYAEGIYSSEISTTFTTECATYTLPFSQDFGTSGTDKPNCWNIANWGSSANSWTKASDFAKTGVALRYNARTLSSADAITPSITISDECELKFYIRNSVGNNSAKVECKVLVNDGTTTTEIADITTRYTAATLQTLDLSAYVGKTVNIIFRGVGYDTSGSPYLWIDDVEVTVKPCEVPAFAAANVVPTTVGANVTCEADKWNLRYKATSAEEWTTVENIVANSYAITGCELGTEYEVQVQAVCSATRKSAWTASQTFTPSCVAPTALTVSAVNANGATIAWTGEAKNLQYRAEGAADWTNVIITEADKAAPYVLSVLEANTTYEVRVQALCAEADEAWTDAETFTTKCGLLSADELPMSVESFSAIPECWETVTTTDYPQVEGTKIFFRGTEEQLLILPSYDIALNKLNVTFGFSDDYSKLEFGYVDEPGGAFTAFATQPTSGESLSLAGEATTAKYIAVRYHDGSQYISASISSVRIAEQVNLVDNADNSAVLAANVGKAIDMTINRTLYADGDYNTICLPFDLSTLDGTPLAGGELWAFSYGWVEGGELLLRVYPTEGIEAGVPYLISWTSGANIVNPTFSNVTIVTSTGKSVGRDENVKFVGILKPEAFEQGDKTKLFVSAGNVLSWSGVATGASNSSLRSFRGYFQTNTAVGGGANPSPIRHGMPARIVMQEEVATGMENIQPSEIKSQKLLEGDQVVIIRNGVKYNIQGQIIQ